MPAFSAAVATREMVSSITASTSTTARSGSGSAPCSRDSAISSLTSAPSRTASACSLPANRRTAPDRRRRPRWPRPAGPWRPPGSSARARHWPRSPGGPLPSAALRTRRWPRPGPARRRSTGRWPAPRWVRSAGCVSERALGSPAGVRRRSARRTPPPWRPRPASAGSTMPPRSTPSSSARWIAQQRPAGLVQHQVTGGGPVAARSGSSAGPGRPALAGPRRPPAVDQAAGTSHPRATPPRRDQPHNPTPDTP